MTKNQIISKNLMANRQNVMDKMAEFELKITINFWHKVWCERIRMYKLKIISFEKLTFSNSFRKVIH